MFSVSVLSFVGNVFRVSISFIGTLLAVRLLGAGAFGDISAVLAHTLWLHYLCTLGLDHTLPTIDDPSLLRRVVVLGVLVAVVLGSVVCVAVVLTSGYVEGPSSVPAQLLAAQMVLSGAAAIFGGYLRATGRFAALVFKDQVLMPVGIFLASSLALMQFGATTFTYALFYALTSVVAFVFGLWLFARDVVSVPLRAAGGWCGEPARSILSSLPVALMSGLEVMIPWGVVLAASYVLAAADVGVLAILLRFGALCSFAALALGPIVSGVLPTILRRSHDDVVRVVQTSIAVSIAWSIGLFAAAWIFEPELRQLIGVERFPVAALALIFLGFVLDGGFGLLKFALITKGERSSNAWMMAIAVAIALITAYVGARAEGLVGAAYGCIAAYGALTVMRWQRAYQLLRAPALSFADARALSIGAVPFLLVAFWSSGFTPSLYARVAGFVAAVAIGVLVLWWLRGRAIRSLLDLYSDTMAPSA